MPTIHLSVLSENDVETLDNLGIKGQRRQIDKQTPVFALSWLTRKSVNTLTEVITQ